MEYVLGLWQKAEETTVTGLPGHILEFDHRAVEPLAREMNSFGYHDLTLKYNEVSEWKKSSWAIRKWVKLLSDIGWVDTEPDSADKRKVVVKVIKKVENTCDSWMQTFLGSFTLESFRNWLEEAGKILEHNQILKKIFWPTNQHHLKGFSKNFTYIKKVLFPIFSRYLLILKWSLKTKTRMEILVSNNHKEFQRL